MLIGGKWEAGDGGGEGFTSTDPLIGRGGNTSTVLLIAGALRNEPAE